MAAKRPIEERSSAVCFVLVMVSEVVAVDPFVSVTCAGAKLHEVPLGSPEQVKITGPARPHLEVTCRVSGEEMEPLVTIRFAAEVESVRAGSLA